MNNIFQQIASQTGGSKVNLDSSAVIKDIVTPAFTVPENASSVSVNTFDCLSYNPETGVATWEANGQAVENAVTINGTEIEITGFDFNKNFIAQQGRNENDVTQEGDFHGRKLVISFTVEAKSDFLGGNNVATNGEASGIYDANGTLIGSFERPVVNVPIKDVSVVAEDKNVYLFGSVTGEQLKENAQVKVGNITLDLTEENFGLEAWQTEYVDITVSLIDDTTAEAITGFDNLVDDQKYGITVTVSPKTEAAEGVPGVAAKPQSEKSTKSVNVFKPEMTFKDSTAYYGDSYPDVTGNLLPTVWKHGSEVASNNMIGTAPSLTWTHDVPATGTMPNEDVYVDVSVKIGEQDVTQYVTFKHQDCKPGEEISEGKEFAIHPLTCTLSITKSGAESDSEGFIFTVTGPNDATYTVSVNGNGTAKLTGLPVGTYTVSEDTSWSWRYKTTSINGNNVLTSTNPESAITVTNEKDNNNWLGGEAYVRNVSKTESTEG